MINLCKKISVVRVAIFEDSKHLRETIQFLLNNTEGYCCTGAYPDCSNLLDDIALSSCDIILMDIEMPGMNGIEATKIIKENLPDIPVLIQTVFFDDDYIFNAICAGASGYILKSTTPAGYIDALAEVQNGGSPITPGIAKKMLELFREKVQAPAPVKKYNLTPQEQRVLQLLVEGKSYKMIASDLFVSFETVKSHIRNIYAKLHVNSGTEAVSLALRDRIV